MKADSAPPKKTAPRKRASDQPTRGKQARAVTTRETILRAAIRVFANKGMAGGRIESIAKLSRTHDRMIYYYFGSKEKLFIEVLETIYQRMNDAESTLQIDIADPVGALTKVVHFTWQYYLSHPEFMTLLNSENLHQGRHVRKSARVGELSSPGVGILEKILEAGAAQRMFRREVRARDLYIAIAALGYFYLSNRYTLSAFLNADLMDQEAVLHWRDFISDMVLRAVMSAPAAQQEPAARSA